MAADDKVRGIKGTLEIISRSQEDISTLIKLTNINDDPDRSEEITFKGNLDSDINKKLVHYYETKDKGDITEQILTCDNPKRVYNYPSLPEKNNKDN